MLEQIATEWLKSLKIRMLAKTIPTPMLSDAERGQWEKREREIAEKENNEIKKKFVEFFRRVFAFFCYRLSSTKKYSVFKKQTKLFEKIHFVLFCFWLLILLILIDRITKIDPLETSDYVETKKSKILIMKQHSILAMMFSFIMMIWMATMIGPKQTQHRTFDNTRTKFKTIRSMRVVTKCQ